MKLPDCPHCDDFSTLTPTGVEPRGVKVCFCSSCGNKYRVNADGAVIHASQSDQNHRSVSR